ncbi:VWA domain-containing protein [Sanguibacter suaedae]|uniref:VWA domain-containing protein n=1 Tax=Sanguibacter suaedae TaxID=2795737 RepID=A0A934MAM4_9MICO|nr:VWA domain-containing protein [Sanguibacter suaedae]MBI9115765.1 VWA domain-containing protein [Sanguibacter suaedae]
MDLARGANTPLTSTDLTVTVTGAVQGTVDLLAFQLTDAGTVRGDHDLVFYNQPASAEGALRLVDQGAITVDLAGVPADVTTVAVAVALDDSAPGALADTAGLGAAVRSSAGSGADDARCIVSGLTTERAVVLLEIYRRQGAWKVRNVSAGWDGGLADLVRELGVAVDDEPAERPAAAAAPAAPASAAQPAPPATVMPPVPPPPPAPPVVPARQEGVRTAPGEERLSLEKRQVLSLRKEAVHRVLLTKGAAQERARVVLVIDKTGSMQRQYKRQVVHRVVERMVPVAVQLDDDGALEPYLYARGQLRLPDLTVAGLEEWTKTYVHLTGRHGGLDYDSIGLSNDEIPIMRTIMDSLHRGAAVPTLVLFFTDGGFSRRRAITELVREASALPAFWQFVGIGRANYGLLTDLDELDGRVVDNVGFFELDDIDKVSDDELYKRLLSELPDWIRAARAAGVLGGAA